MSNLWDYSGTASSNTTIEGLNTAEGMPVGNVDNSLRAIVALMFNSFTSSLENFFLGTAPLPVANGGTGATDVAGVRTAISAAASGANTDITALDQDVTVTATGTIAANSIGYRGLPANSQTGAYALALSDAGKHISITTGGVTIPANGSVAFPVGTAIIIYNDSSSTQSIAITTDTLRQAGTTSTGTRTLAAYGIASLLKVGSTTWAISGNIS